MKLDVDRARLRFVQARVARLATASSDGRPHVVPIVFALDGDTLYSAVDAKPKRTASLRRLDNIKANPNVSVLVDHYDDDWNALWWVRADGIASVADDADADVVRGRERLAEKYAQYRMTPLTGATIIVRINAWSGWTAVSDPLP